ncbi:nuclear receptor coactivator 6-like isoform X2 [Mya arenaria]|uniref:nuclear receptor coactivator 6-like isoform X2 n=1 Tax=Mya arenaria TaxID=6604 RepID=UPI0022DEFB3A|nr:nuclear receptor coactivator 6-like isoform X2 [Mya arenaria]
MGPQEDYIETVFTCEGDFHDPHLKDRLEDFKRSLKDLLLTDKNKLILKKVEPWNSVKVTFKIPREAAIRLKQLAQQGNATLKELGVLAVQIQDQNISLTIAGKNNEHTQLVFRTADSSQATTPTVSVIGTNSPALDGLSPQGPGPGPNLTEKTSQNIAEYLRQLLPAHIAEAQKAKNNFMPFPGFEPGKGSSHPHASVSGYQGNATSMSPSSNAISPGQSTMGGPSGIRFPHAPGMPPGLQPGLKQALDNLPPPPPYPGEGSAHQNNIQKLRLGPTTPSTLLVNLLEPAFAQLLNAGKLPPGLDPETMKPAKKKRKPRQPKEKKEKKGAQTVSSVSGVSMPTTTMGIPSATVPSLASARLMNSDLNPSVTESGFHNVPQALLHNTSVQKRVPLTSPVTHGRKHDEDTAGKIINPVTGVLEPVDLSDTSPAKSDGDKNSPRSLQGQKKPSLGELKIEDLRRTPNLMGRPQGMLSHPVQNIQRPLSEHPNPHSLMAGALYVSSHSVSKDTSGLTPQVHYQEALKNSNPKSHMKNDIMPPVNTLEHMLPATRVGAGNGGKPMCDKISAVNVGGKQDTLQRRMQQAQENDVNTIPIQLLNKPLLQVKHDSALRTGKPSGSPDSNGDSECSTQSISLDTQTCPDPSGPSGLHSDHRAYNTDSGVGSCSERSDVSPSDIIDTDFKAGSVNIFDTCAKPLGTEPVKQQVVQPSTKVMTVGYALEETHVKKMPVKNHKIVSMQSSEKDKPLPLESVRPKTDTKSDVCSTSQSRMMNMTPEERQIANNVKEILKKAASETLNRKSPKLATPGHNSVPHRSEGNHNAMQGAEVSMPKKKSSPRNSPRNPGSPRNPSSPRGGASPRTSDGAPSPHQAWQFHPNQDLISAHLAARESQSKSPMRDSGRAPLMEQRRSPFNMLPDLLPAQRLGGHVSSETVPQPGEVLEALSMRPQCNMDNIALLKSLEAYAHPHLNQLNMMAANKDPALIQKIEELRPLFKLHKQMSVASAAVNGLENMNHVQCPVNLSVSTVKSANSTMTISEASTSHNTIVASSVSIGPFGTNILSTTVTSASSVSSMPKSNKVNSDEQKAAQHKRSSATPNSSNPTHSLPAPSRLTESVQKLLNFPLIDHPNTSLPPSNRRSPSCSGNVTRTNASHMVTTQCNSVVRGSVSPTTHVAMATSRHQALDNSHIDLDSITPSISGFGLGPMNLHFDSQIPLDFSNHSDSASFPSLTSVMATSLSGLSCPVISNVVSGSTTKLVPAVTGSITSHTTGVSAASVKVSPQSNKEQIKEAAVNAPVLQPADKVVCNSDSITTVSSVRNTPISRTPAPLLSRGPPILQPQTTLLQSGSQNDSDSKLKTSLSQMGLSEMLQETANINKNVIEKQAVITKAPATTLQSSLPSQLIHQAQPGENVMEHLKNHIEEQIRSSSPGNGNIEVKNTNCDAKSNTETPKLESGQGLKASVKNSDNSEIPKLKRQTNLNIHVPTTFKSSPLNTPTIGSDSYDSDLKSQDSCSSNSSTPPVLTAVSDIPETKPQSNATDSTILELSQPSSSSDNGNAKESEPVPDLEELTLSLVTKAKEKHQMSDLKNDKPLEVTNEKPVYDDSEFSQTNANSKTKSSRKRRASSESVEDRYDEHDPKPRQLRSRKRPNPNDQEIAQPEDAKRQKQDTCADTVQKVEHKDIGKSTGLKAPTPTSQLNDSNKCNEELSTNSQHESIKSGLRTRTNSKTSQPTEVQEKAKGPIGRDGRKDGKGTPSKSAPEKKVEPVKPEDGKRPPPSRRNRQSPSVQPQERALSQPGVRERSPQRTGKTRGRNSPLTVENMEELSHDNKRTTRSAKTKDAKVPDPPPPQPASKAATASAAKRRRTTSQDHR